MEKLVIGRSPAVHSFGKIHLWENTNLNKWETKCNTNNKFFTGEETNNMVKLDQNKILQKIVRDKLPKNNMCKKCLNSIQ